MSSGAAGHTLLALRRVHPEWRPLLVLVNEALHEVGNVAWLRYVPALAHERLAGRPLLDGAAIHVPPSLVERWVGRVLRVAATAGTRVEPLASAIEAQRLNPLRLFRAGVCQDVDRLERLARTVNDDGVGALVPFIAMPMLHACRRAWATRIRGDWSSGYCPVCGAWPAFAEVRGLNGSRHLRCGRCGGDWETEPRRCPFCGDTDLETIGDLVWDEGERCHTIVACGACRTYVKTITTLSTIRAQDVVLHDLATMGLDLTALEHAYRRPAASARKTTVTVKPRTWRLRDLIRLGA